MVVRYNLVNICNTGNFYKVLGLENIDSTESFDDSKQVVERVLLHSVFNILSNLIITDGVWCRGNIIVVNLT